MFEAGADGSPEIIASGVDLGDPAGIALGPDEASVWVSSQAAAGTSQVLIVERASRATAVFDDVIRANRASGGLHQAGTSGTYAWVDSGGGIYVVRAPRVQAGGS